MKVRESAVALAISFIWSVAAPSASVAADAVTSSTDEAAKQESNAVVGDRAEGGHQLLSSGKHSLLPPELVEIQQMLDAGIGQDVVVAYIRNSPTTYTLTAGQIVLLHEMGVPDPIVQALLEHSPADEKPRDLAPSSLQIREESTDVVPDAVYIPGPPPVPQTLTIGDFYQALAPYGQWRDFPGLGWCWRPTMVASDWQPYRENGQWLWSDCGWYWNSEYPWGWAAFHYGRWWRHPRDGWMWMPDLKWAPAWVCWRKTDRYVGWAPLPPGADFAMGRGWTFRGNSVNRHTGFAVPAASFTFVPYAEFLERPAAAALGPSGAKAAYRRSSVENNYSVGWNNHIIDWGAGTAQIRAANGGELPRVAVLDRERNSSGPGLELRSGVGGSRSLTNSPDEDSGVEQASFPPAYPGNATPWLDAPPLLPMGGTGESAGEAIAFGGVSFDSGEGGHHHHHPFNPGDTGDWQWQSGGNPWTQMALRGSFRNMPLTPVGFGRLGSGRMGFGSLGGGMLGTPGAAGATPWLALGAGVSSSGSPWFAPSGGWLPAGTTPGTIGGSPWAPGFAQPAAGGPAWAPAGVPVASSGGSPWLPVGAALPSSTGSPWFPVGANPPQPGGSPWMPVGTQPVTSGGSPWVPVGATPPTAGGSPWMPVGAVPPAPGASPWLPVGATPPTAGGSPWLPVGAVPPGIGGSPWLPVGAVPPTPGGSPWLPVGAIPPTPGGSPWLPVGALPPSSGGSPWLPVGAVPPAPGASPWLPVGAQPGMGGPAFLPVGSQVPTRGGVAWQPVGTIPPTMGRSGWLPVGSAPVTQLGSAFSGDVQVPRFGTFPYGSFAAFPSLPSPPTLPSAPMLPAAPTLPGGPMLPSAPTLPSAPMLPSPPTLPGAPFFNVRPGAAPARAFAPAVGGGGHVGGGGGGHR